MKYGDHRSPISTLRSLRLRPQPSINHIHQVPTITQWYGQQFGKVGLSHPVAKWHQLFDLDYKRTDLFIVGVGWKVILSPFFAIIFLR